MRLTRPPRGIPPTARRPGSSSCASGSTGPTVTDEAERRLRYQTVLHEGTATDVVEYLHLPTLLAIWDTLWLPAAVHHAWDAWAGSCQTELQIRPLCYTV